MRASPCKDCEKRAVGCHGNCEEYIDYRKLCDEDIAQRAKKRSVDILQFSGKRSRKCMKKKQSERTLHYGSENDDTR